MTKIPQDLQRETSIITKFLLPTENLSTIAKVYGLSRERVRQIISRANFRFKTNLKESKTYLLKESPNLKCYYCGQALLNKKDLTVKKYHTYFCSSSCYLKSHKFSWHHILICQYCNSEYFPFRNKVHYLKINKDKFSFCCIEHYWAYRKQTTQMKKST
jgi:hypothetical protein